MRLLDNTFRALLALVAIPAAASGPLSGRASNTCLTAIPDRPVLFDQADSFPVEEAISMERAEGPDRSALLELEREQERVRFQQILRDRDGLPVLSPIDVPLPAARFAEINAPVDDSGPVKIGVALRTDQRVQFPASSLSAAKGQSTAVAAGQAMILADGSALWEAGVVSRDARELRVFFSDLDLAPGASLWLYNEIGQVFGPYVGNGPDANGELWSPSVLGDRLRIHLRAESASALAGSRLTIASVTHMGSRVAALGAVVQGGYMAGPDDPRAISFCGVDVPDCSLDASCALASIPELGDATNAVAHLRYDVDGAGYICTGALIAQSGNSPQQPLLLTANHCFDTQASASSLEAYFQYRSTGCGGTCPDVSALPRVNGATLLATGAFPAQPDFTLVRLSGFYAGSARLLGWNTALPPENSGIIHVGHPGGSPQAYGFRRLRSSGLPYSPELPRPVFMYSGLALESGDSEGATAGGSSGGPALLWRGSGLEPVIVGQLFGAVTPAGVPRDECDPNHSTVDGALNASFPNLRRFIYDKLFAGDFQ